MNEKQAREIAGRAKPRLVTVGMDFAEGKAEGYLENLDKAKGLEEFVIQADCQCKVLDVYPEVRPLCKRCEALAKYRSEK